jgi:NAD(P)H dehydrogenase (quinone)
LTYGKSRFVGANFFRLSGFFVAHANFASASSGKLGKLVIQELLARGISNIIATTRTPDGLAEIAAKGVDVRTADFNNPTTLADAFEGGTRMLLISTLDVGSRVPQHGAAIVAAKAAGVQHVIYTSWPDPQLSIAAVSPDHAGTEELILKSGLKYTFLGNYSYSELLMFSLPKALEGGTLYGAAGTGRAAYVTRQDCAYAAAGVLEHAALHENKRYRISGPQAYSHTELAALVSEITGKKLTYVDLPPEEFKKALVGAGMPEGFAQMFLGFELAIKGGELEPVTQAVEELSGHNPLSLRSYLESALK